MITIRSKLILVFLALFMFSLAGSATADPCRRAAKRGHSWYGHVTIGGISIGLSSGDVRVHADWRYSPPSCDIGRHKVKRVRGNWVSLEEWSKPRRGRRGCGVQAPFRRFSRGYYEILVYHRHGRNACGEPNWELVDIVPGRLKTRRL